MRLLLFVVSVLVVAYFSFILLTLADSLNELIKLFN